METTNKKYNWTTYTVPRLFPDVSDALLEAEGQMPPDPQTFTIRHLKQGRTGAVKTWPVAEVLLNYLVLHGGLRNVSDNLLQTTDAGVEGVLDLTPTTGSPETESDNRGKLDKFGVEAGPESGSYNIVELGGGTGYLSVGLALALADTVPNESKNHRVRILCTDNDKATIKNMRHNVTQQPRHMKVNKSVRVQPLSWGSDIGGEKFSNAATSHFHEKRSCSNDSNSDYQGDPIRLLSHIIAADVLYGETTMDPLSSIISASKIRNPSVAVILLLKERSPDAVTNLKHQIESKLRLGLELENSTAVAEELEGFSVRVRDVLHPQLSDMKMVEC